MQVQEALRRFYMQNGFGEAGGRNAATAIVYAGPWTVRLPNIRARKRLLPFHDIHHVVTGYGTDRVGEAQLCAWEIGSGSLREPMALFMNLVGLFTGLLYGPPEVYEAYRRGCSSKNTYGRELEGDLFPRSLDQLRGELLPAKRVNPLRPVACFQFAICALVALILGVPLVVLAGVQRTIANIRRLRTWASARCGRPRRSARGMRVTCKFF